eukprot:700086-Pyramimonas_sp.AAC.1
MSENVQLSMSAPAHVHAPYVAHERLWCDKIIYARACTIISKERISKVMMMMMMMVVMVVVMMVNV